MKDEFKNEVEKALKHLGHGDVEFVNIETIPVVLPGRWKPEDMRVTLECTEFTCRCPITNQPDWATIEVQFKPDKLLVESKSFKLYLETYRDKGVFHEHLVQMMLEDLIAVLDPLEIEVTACFNSRGGIAITATASWVQGRVRRMQVPEEVK